MATVATTNYEDIFSTTNTTANLNNQLVERVKSIARNIDYITKSKPDTSGLLYNNIQVLQDFMNLDKWTCYDGQDNIKINRYYKQCITWLFNTVQYLYNFIYQNINELRSPYMTTTKLMTEEFDEAVKRAIINKTNDIYASVGTDSVSVSKIKKYLTDLYKLELKEALINEYVGDLDYNQLKIKFNIKNKINKYITNIWSKDGKFIIRLYNELIQLGKIQAQHAQHIQHEQPSSPTAVNTFQRSLISEMPTSPTSPTRSLQQRARARSRVSLEEKQHLKYVSTIERINKNNEKSQNKSLYIDSDSFVEKYIMRLTRQTDDNDSIGDIAMSERLKDIITNESLTIDNDDLFNLCMEYLMGDSQRVNDSINRIVRYVESVCDNYLIDHLDNLEEFQQELTTSLNSYIKLELDQLDRVSLKFSSRLTIYTIILTLLIKYGAIESLHNHIIQDYNEYIEDPNNAKADNTYPRYDWFWHDDVCYCLQVLVFDKSQLPNYLVRLFKTMSLIVCYRTNLRSFTMIQEREKWSQFGGGNCEFWGCVMFPLLFSKLNKLNKSNPYYPLFHEVQSLNDTDDNTVNIAFNRPQDRDGNKDEITISKINKFIDYGCVIGYLVMFDLTEPWKDKPKEIISTLPKSLYTKSIFEYSYNPGLIQKYNKFIKVLLSFCGDALAINTNMLKFDNQSYNFPFQINQDSTRNDGWQLYGHYYTIAQNKYNGDELLANILSQTNINYSDPNMKSQLNTILKSVMLAKFFISLSDDNSGNSNSSAGISKCLTNAMSGLSNKADVNIIKQQLKAALTQLTEFNNKVDLKTHYSGETLLTFLRKLNNIIYNQYSLNFIKSRYTTNKEYINNSLFDLFVYTDNSNLRNQIISFLLNKNINTREFISKCLKQYYERFGLVNSDPRYYNNYMNDIANMLTRKTKTLTLSTTFYYNDETNKKPEDFITDTKIKEELEAANDELVKATNTEEGCKLRINEVRQPCREYNGNKDEIFNDNIDYSTTAPSSMLYNFRLYPGNIIDEYGNADKLKMLVEKFNKLYNQRLIKQVINTIISVEVYNKDLGRFLALNEIIQDCSHDISDMIQAINSLNTTDVKQLNISQFLEDKILSKTMKLFNVPEQGKPIIPIVNDACGMYDKWIECLNWLISVYIPSLVVNNASRAMEKTDNDNNIKSIFKLFNSLKATKSLKVFKKSNIDPVSLWFCEYEMEYDIVSRIIGNVLIHKQYSIDSIIKDLGKQTNRLLNVLVCLVPVIIYYYHVIYVVDHNENIEEMRKEYMKLNRDLYDKLKKDYNYADPISYQIEVINRNQQQSQQSQHRPTTISFCVFYNKIYLNYVKAKRQYINFIRNTMRILLCDRLSKLIQFDSTNGSTDNNSPHTISSIIKENEIVLSKDEKQLYLTENYDYLTNYANDILDLEESVHNKLYLQNRIMELKANINKDDTPEVKAAKMKAYDEETKRLKDNETKRINDKKKSVSKYYNANNNKNQLISAYENAAFINPSVQVISIDPNNFTNDGNISFKYMTNDYDYVISAADSSGSDSSDRSVMLEYIDNCIYNVYIGTRLKINPFTGQDNNAAMFDTKSISEIANDISVYQIAKNNIIKKMKEDYLYKDIEIEQTNTSKLNYQIKVLENRIKDDEEALEYAESHALDVNNIQQQLDKDQKQLEQLNSTKEQIDKSETYNKNIFNPNPYNVGYVDLSSLCKIKNDFQKYEYYANSLYDLDDFVNAIKECQYNIQTEPRVTRFLGGESKLTINKVIKIISFLLLIMLIVIIISFIIRTVETVVGSSNNSKLKTERITA